MKTFSFISEVTKVHLFPPSVSPKEVKSPFSGTKPSKIRTWFDRDFDAMFKRKLLKLLKSEFDPERSVANTIIVTRLLRLVV